MSVSLDFVFIGAGRVATCMADAFKDNGLKVSCVYSRTEASASSLASKIGCGYVTDLGALPKAGVYIVMLTDDVLLSLAGAIVRVCPEALFLHTSGSVPMSLWKDAGAAHYGVLYPMQTFSKGKKVAWKSVPVFIEASSRSDMELIGSIADTVSDNVREMDSETRCRMHLAAVFATNFTNRMYAISEALLKECGLPFQVMLPLVHEAASKVSTLSPLDSQTGPAVRGDERVLCMHRELLKSHPEWLDIYNRISADIQKAYNDGTGI